MADELMHTIGGDGKVATVPVKDWEKWLDTNRKLNPDIRPPGTGPNGEWTVEDEQAAVDLYDENKDYANDDRSYDKEGELREIWDILADEAAITGPVDSFTVPLSEPPAEGFDFEAHADQHWALKEAKKQGAMDPQIREGLTELLPTPETFGALANGAARKAIEQSATKRPSESEYRTYKGFGEWEPTQKWHDEQFTGPLTDEQRLPTKD